MEKFYSRLKYLFFPDKCTVFYHNPNLFMLEFDNLNVTISRGPIPSAPKDYHEEPVEMPGPELKMSFTWSGKKYKMVKQEEV